MDSFFAFILRFLAVYPLLFIILLILFILI